MSKPSINYDYDEKLSKFGHENGNDDNVTTMGNSDVDMSMDIDGNTDMGMDTVFDTDLAMAMGMGTGLDNNFDENVDVNTYGEDINESDRDRDRYRDKERDRDRYRDKDRDRVGVRKRGMDMDMDIDMRVGDNNDDHGVENGRYKKINNLEQFLSENELLVEKFFGYNGKLSYILCTTKESGTQFLMDVSIDYDIEVDVLKNNTFPLKKIKVPKNDQQQKQQQYHDDAVHGFHIPSLLGGKEDIPDQTLYQVPIGLCNDSLIDLQHVEKQLKRLNLSLLHSKFSIMIFYKNYLCNFANKYKPLFVGKYRKNSVNVFQNEKTTKNEDNTFHFMLCINLEYYYEKNQEVSKEIHYINTLLLDMLTKNHKKHITFFTKIMHPEHDFFQHLQSLNEYKLGYINTLEKCKKVYEILRTDAEKYQTLFNKLVLSYNTTDADKFDYQPHKIIKIQEKIKKIDTYKIKLLDNIIKINRRHLHLLLILDRICFDNIEHFNEINKNFSLIALEFLT